MTAINLKSRDTRNKHGVFANIFKQIPHFFKIGKIPP